MKYQKCNTCNGSGKILNHLHPTHSGQRSAGMGMSVCPSCNGSGNSGALDLSSRNVGGKSGAELQGEKIGEGCATVLFSVGPYIIVFSALYNLIVYVTDFLSKNYTLSVPDWLPWVNIILISVIVILCRKFIGWLALLSIVVFIGIQYLYVGDLTQQTTPHNKSAASKNTVAAPKKITTNITPKKSTLIEQCQSCSKILNFKGKLPTSILEGKRRYCEKFKTQCVKKGYKW